MASVTTNSGSEEVPSSATLAHTVLVSRECCHAAGTVPSSIGLGLKKWVVPFYGTAEHVTIKVEHRCLVNNSKHDVINFTDMNHIGS